MQLRNLIQMQFTLEGTGRYQRALEHDSLVYDAEKDLFFWNSRKIHGDKFTWARQILNLSWKEAVALCGSVERKDVLDTDEVLEQEEQPETVTDTSLIKTFWEAGRDSYYWLKIRGYTQETVDRFKLGYAGRKERNGNSYGVFTIPIYEDGKLVNFQCRGYPEKVIKHWYRGVGPHTFNFSMLPYTKTVYIAEGLVDAIMLAQYGLPAISQSSGAGDVRLFEKNFGKFAHIEKIFIVYDNDVAGNKGAYAVANIFGEKAKIYNFWDFDSKFDVSDFFRGGGDKDSFVSLVQKKSKIKEELGLEQIKGEKNGREKNV